MKRRLTPFVLAASLALPLAACGEDTPAATPSTVTVTETPEPQEAGPEQRQLTEDEIMAALPSEDEAPRGFRIDKRGFDTTTVSQRTTDPESCLALYMSTQEQRDFTKEHGGDSGAIRFSSRPGEPGSPGISIAIWSFDEPFPQKFFDQAGAALAECQDHTTQISPDDSPGEWQADAIPTPTVGDQSFGVRIGRPDVDLAIDYMWVRSGHNLIHARMITGYRQSNDQRLQKYTQGIVDELKKGTS